MTHDQPISTPEPLSVPVLEPIQMPSPLGDQPVPFQPHSALCAAFAERTASYLAELGTLTNDMRALAAAIPPAARHDPRQRLHADKQAERYVQLYAGLQRLVARMVNLRGELNAWLCAAALACPSCAAHLPTQPWPLQDVTLSLDPMTSPAAAASEPVLLSEVLRRELRERRAAHN